MPMIIGCREYTLFIWLIFPNNCRQFFPSTEPEKKGGEDESETVSVQDVVKEDAGQADSEWEEVEAGESAENGPTSTGGDVEGDDPAESQAELKEMLAELTTDRAEIEGTDVSSAELVALPEVPATEPADQGPSPKKHKRNGEDVKP